MSPYDFQFTDFTSATIGNSITFAIFSLPAVIGNSATLWISVYLLQLLETASPLRIFSLPPAAIWNNVTLRFSVYLLELLETASSLWIFSLSPAAIGNCVTLRISVMICLPAPSKIKKYMQNFPRFARKIRIWPATLTALSISHALTSFRSYKREENTG